MGGKTTTATQSVQIPPEVMARYNAVNARAEDVASRPFIPYSNDPNAFVAALTPSQQAGIENINAAAGMSQPSFAAGQNMILGGLSQGTPLVQQGLGQGQALTGNALDVGSRFGANAEQAIGAGMGPVNAEQFSGAQIDKYMSPYMRNVVEAQQALQQQEAEQQRSALNSQAIMSGAFGGDRGGIAQANLARQQSLANQATLANLLQGGYGQALGAFQQQQGVNLQAGQANRAAMQNAANQLAALGQQQYAQSLGAGQNLYNMGLGAGQALYGMGTGAGQAYAGLGAQAEQAALNAGQAQMAAGQIQQQTDQAGKTAMYNQFLQQQGFPFQQAQFLANIAMGTGALSGNTTTTTQPSGWSDRRLKENIRKVGETYDGQDIYAYNLKGEKHTQLGLMAQEVEKHTPEAVGESQGYKTLDYKKATDDAAERGHFASGGLVPSSMGGAVYEPGAFARGGYADGGYAAGDYEKLPNGNYLAPDSSVLTPQQYQSQYGMAANTPSPSDQIAGLYQSKLGRTGSADEYKYWSDLMASRGLSADQIGQEIANSTEGKAYATQQADTQSKVASGDLMATGIKNAPYQETLKYNPAAFAPRAPITRNASGFAAAAPGSSYSSFAPPTTTATPGTPQATGKGPTTPNYSAPMATGKGPAPTTNAPSNPLPPPRYGSAVQTPAATPTISGKGPATVGYPGSGTSMPTASGKSPATGRAYGGRIAKQGGGAALLQQLAAQHAAQYGQMPGAPGAEPYSRIKHTLQMPSAEAQRRLSPGSLPAKPQGGVQSAMNMGKSFADLYKSGKEIKKDVTDFFKEDNSKKVGGGETVKTTQPAAAPAARPEGQGADLMDQTRDSTMTASEGLGAARDNLDFADMGGGGDLMSMFAARGGRIERYAGGRLGYRAGGLPTGLAPGEGIDIPDEVAGYKLGDLGAKGMGGGGGGGSALNAIGTAVGVASTAAKIIPFLASLSDSRVKHHKEPIGELFDGQKVYRYDFGNGRTEIGLLAQEVEKHRPDAVRTVNGLKVVDYDRAISRAKKQGGGGLSDILLSEEERRPVEEATGLAPPAEEEAINDNRIRMAALQRAETMSDAEPIGAARMAALPAPTGLAPASEASATPREETRPSATPAVVASAPPAAAAAPASDGDRQSNRERIIQQTLPYISQRESGDQNVPNKEGTSSAFGPFQFTKGTWRTTIQKHPELRDLTESDRLDPAAQRRVAPYHARDLADSLERSGVEFTPSTLRMGWFLGTGDGPAFMKGLRADPDRPALELVGPAAVSANKSVFFTDNGKGRPRTANEVLAMMTRGIEGGASRQAAGAEVVKGDGSPVEKATRIASRATEGNWEKIGEKVGVPELARDERVFVPLIAGIGALLASDKPRFSQALGEGLGAAAGAYGAVRGQTQELAASKAREAADLIAGAKGSILTDSSGRPYGIIIFDPKTGGLRQMDFGEAYRRRDELNLLPATREEMERYVRANPDLAQAGRSGAAAAGTGSAADTGSSTGTGAATGAGSTSGSGARTAPGAPRTEVTPPAVPGAPEESKKPAPAAPVGVSQIFSPDDTEVARINAESQKLIGSDLSKLPDYYTRAADQSKAAANQRSLLFQFAGAYAGLPDKGPMTPGAFAPAVRTVGEGIQSGLESIGIKGPMSKADIGRAVTIDKVTAEMKARASTEAGQRSYAAFNEMGARAPTLGTPKAGGAKAMASIIVNNQAAIDEDLFAKNLLDKADENNKYNARYTGQVINEMFTKRFGPKLEQDRDAIATMFTEPVKFGGQVLKDPETNRPINWMQWLSDPKNAASLDKSEQAIIEKRFGEGILRYFPGVRR